MAESVILEKQEQEDYDDNIDMLFETEDDEELNQPPTAQPSSSSDKSVDKLITSLKEGQGLSNDLFLEIIKDTESENRAKGVDDSYAGTSKSEKEIDLLLNDVEVPLEVKTETNATGNILNVSNYTEFLLLQSRLTGVPFDTLLEGLKIFDDEGNMQERVVTEDDFTSEEVETIVDTKLEEVEPEEVEYERNYDYDDNFGNVDEIEDEEVDNLDEDISVEDEDYDIEVDEEIPELMPDTSDTGDGLDIEIEEDVPIQVDLSKHDEIEEINPDDIDLNEGFEGDIASPEDSMFDTSSRNKITGSKVYALHQLNSGGNYDV